jgi:hypothetical protein
MPQDNQLGTAIRRLGEASWLILRALGTAQQAIPGIEVIRRVEGILQAANYPYQTIDGSTTHYALRRLMEIGLVKDEGQMKVEIPIGHGFTRYEVRTVYSITPLGLEALKSRDRLAAAEQQRA